MTDVTTLILEDHTQLREIFAKMKSGSASQRELLLPVAASLLIAHARAEEAEVYPAVRDEADDAEDVEHSQAEHAAAEQAMVKLMGTPAGGGDFESALAAVVEAVTHHMEEEESDVLPAMSAALSTERLDQLGDAFLRARFEHLGDRPGEPSRADLEIQAQNAGIPGRSGMNREQLQEAVQDSAEL